MAYHQPQNPFEDDIYTTPRPQMRPPRENLDRDDFDRESTLRPRGWDVRGWPRRTWALLATIIVIIIVVIVAVVVVKDKKKNNSYPAYAPLKYTLADTFSGTNFFDNFDYYTGYDPSQGFVHYVPAAQANDPMYNLTYASASSAVLRVDTTVNAETVPDASTGRFSVRIQSKKQYATGLFVFDVLHTPVGCATWPALWLSDPANWPANGEIDVMEAVNVVNDAQSQVTLHTADGCSMNSVRRLESGSVITTSCVNSTDSNAGCGVDAGSKTFGDTLNANGGAVAAMELRSDGIRVWQFDRSAVPADITAGQPDPSTWGEATADFPNTDCDIGNHFRNQSIIANIDLCGSWAGDPHVYNATCPGLCTDYVAKNNTAFQEAYWEFGAFTVYQAA